ncbi:hypothetical protein BE20_38440 [Sorangium cellulosum]|uniref:Uncharacterized protein n=1 Tax=Sorangium cellulosum TaxID=56 RepID=A0A150S031_SORCE|nr:hypothetical protein BE18_20375 [Sorangium cellulosum]KYF97500.1 hypothetical protein BE20_38440 [Sorangium cellulosum]
MYRISTADFAALALVFLVSCVTDQGEEEGPVGIAPNALEYLNAMNPNALNPNALNPNALNPNALSQNALSPGALSPAALSAIQDPGAAGDLSRQLLSYVVGCALTPAQSFRFSWTDGAGTVRHEVYWGLIGLVPSWIDKPLGQTDQQWISACLASRTNWYGVSVTISSRASHPAIDKTDSPELASYTRMEGAFWGNLFAPTPYLNACYNAANRDHARSLARECAAGHLDASGAAQPCGMISIRGTCDSYCQQLNMRGMYYPSCVNNLTGSPDSTTRVITVFLP